MMPSRAYLGGGIVGAAAATNRSAKSLGLIGLAFALVTEQCAITATDETQPLLDQANDPAANIACFPSSIGNATRAEQACRDFAIAVSFHPSICGTQSKDEPMLGLNRQYTWGRPERALFERSPKALCRLRANVEIAVEREIDDNH